MTYYTYKRPDDNYKERRMLFVDSLRIMKISEPIFKSKSLLLLLSIVYMLEMLHVR